MKRPSNGDTEPILVRRRRPRGGRVRRGAAGVLKRAFLMGAAGLLLAWVLMAALRPFLLDYQEVAQLRRVEAELATAEAENEALRQRIRTLNTPKGVEVEARRLGWVRPGEVLIQTSEEPPRAPAPAPQTPETTPPLGAVQPRQEGILGRAAHLASRALTRLRSHRAPSE